MCACLSVQYYNIVEIAIRQCRSSGIDCKIHGLAVRGRLRSDDDTEGLPVNALSYLASDGEDDTAAVVEDQMAKNDDVRLRQSAAAARGPREILTNVFVWGLNDKDQLGGPKGSKVAHICYSCALFLFMLAKIIFIVILVNVSVSVIIKNVL